MKLTVKGGRICISFFGDILERGTEEETKKTFQAYKKYLVQVLSKDKKSKEVIIDWQKLEEIIQAADGCQQRAIRQYVHAVLLSLGILTRSPRGSYSFSDKGLNPIWGKPGADYSSRDMGNLFFARKDDAREYGKYAQGDSIEDWYISRAVEMITKEEACKS